MNEYKGYPSISTDEYKEVPFLKLTLDSLKEGILQENMTECVCKIEVKKDNLIRCPHCGESYYMENHSECTAVYYPPIYKDGVNINPDKNTTTTRCTCMNCHKDFSYDSSGKINVINSVVKATNIDFTDKDINNLFGL